MIDRKSMAPGQWIEVRDPTRRISYGEGGTGLFQIIKVGRVNVHASCNVRFSPTGPVFHQKHVIPLLHVVRIVPPAEVVPLR